MMSIMLVVSSVENVWLCFATSLHVWGRKFAHDDDGDRAAAAAACLPVRLSLGGGSVRVGGARAAARRSETKTRRKMMEAQKK